MPRDRENWLRWKREEYRRKRDSILAKRKEAYRKNPEKFLAANRKRKRQGGDGAPPHEGVCQICERADMLYYDHNHATAEFRGWICTNCNTGIGLFRDDVNALRNAATYLLWAGRGKKQLVKIGAA